MNLCWKMYYLFILGFSMVICLVVPLHFVRAALAAPVLFISSKFYSFFVRMFLDCCPALLRLQLIWFWYSSTGNSELLCYYTNGIIWVFSCAILIIENVDVWFFGLTVTLFLRCLMPTNKVPCTFKCIRGQWSRGARPTQEFAPRQS